VCTKSQVNETYEIFFIFTNWNVRYRGRGRRGLYEGQRGEKTIGEGNGRETKEDERRWRGRGGLKEGVQCKG
jgi:hypothetical protein